MTSSASCSPETTSGLLASSSTGPRSNNSSSLSPDGGNVSSIGNIGGGGLPLHLLHQHQLQQRSSFHVGDMTNPFDTGGNGGGIGTRGGICSSNNSWLQQENDYFKELAELLQENLNRPEMLQGVNSQALRDMIRQLQQLKDTKKDNAIQHGDVSSSGPTLLASHIGPMLLEALDGFFFVMNTDGFVEFVSQNVQKYLKYSQAEMLNKPIFNFLPVTDHELFTRLLPDSMAWHLLDINSSSANGRERRSHTFMCRFLINNEILMNGKDHSNSLMFENLQVSAISLPYPNIEREMDEFLSFNTVADSQPCLVCVARRVPDASAGNMLSTGDKHFGLQRSSSSASNTGGQQQQNAKGSSSSSSTNKGFQEGVQFSLLCKPETTEILSVDCKDNAFRQFLTNKDAIAGRLRHLCHPSDLPLLDSHIRNVLDHGSDCLSQLRMYCPASSMATVGVSSSPQSSPYSSLLFLQARSRLVNAANEESSSILPTNSLTAVQLDFTLLRVTEAASSSSTTPLISSLAPSSYHGNNGQQQQTSITPETIKASSSSSMQQNPYSASSTSSSSTFDSTFTSTPQSATSGGGGEYVSSSFGGDSTGHCSDGNNGSTSTPFDLFLDVDMQFDCLQQQQQSSANSLPSSSSTSSQQHSVNYGGGYSGQQHVNRQLPSSTTLSPPEHQQQQQQQQQVAYQHASTHKLSVQQQQHHRHASGVRKPSAPAALTPNSRCPSTLSEPVSSTAGAACNGMQSGGGNGQDDLQRLCSMFFDSPDLDANGPMSASVSSPAASYLHPSGQQQQQQQSPYQQMAKPELASPGMCQQRSNMQHQQQQAAQYGDLNILKNLLAHEEQQQQQQAYQQYHQHQAQQQQPDQKPNIQELMMYQQQQQIAGDQSQSTYPASQCGPGGGAFGANMGMVGGNAALPVAVERATPTGKAAKGSKKATKANGGAAAGGRKQSKKAQQQQQKQLTAQQQAAAAAQQQQQQQQLQQQQQSPVLEQLLKPELGSNQCSGGQYAMGQQVPPGNQPHMNILTSLLQEEESGAIANPNQTPPIYGRTASVNSTSSPMFAGGPPPSGMDSGSAGVASPFTSTPTSTPNSRKRRGSSYSSTHSMEQPISSTTGSPPMAPNTTSTLSPAAGGQQQQMQATINHQGLGGPPPAKQSTSLLVQLLEQAAPQTRTLPTSIASSPLDKLAKENKENPNKPRVSTVLVETLLTRPRTSTPTTAPSQHHQMMHHAATTHMSQASGSHPSATFSAPYVATPPMFMQPPGQMGSGMEYGNTGGGGPVFSPQQHQHHHQQHQQQQFPQQPFPHGGLPGNGPMYPPMDQPPQMQYMDGQQQQYGGPMIPGAPSTDLTRPPMPFPQQQQQAPGQPQAQGPPAPAASTAPPVRPGRQPRQPGGSNVRQQLLLQQQKRGKQHQQQQQHHLAIPQQQMPVGMYAPPSQQGASPRAPPPYPGLPPPPPSAPVIPQHVSSPFSPQAMAAFRPSSMPHYQQQSQSLPPTPTLQQQQAAAAAAAAGQSPQQQQSAVFNFDGPPRFPSSNPMPGQFLNNVHASPPQMMSPPGPGMMNGPPPFYRMPQPGGMPVSPLVPSDVVRHELRQAVQNRAQLHQQQAAAMMTGQQQFQQQQQQAQQFAAWHRSQSMPGGMDRRGSKDFGSPPGQTELPHHQQATTQQQQQQQQQMPPPYAGTMLQHQQHQLLSPSASSRSNSGAPPTDPIMPMTPGGIVIGHQNGGGPHFDNNNMDQQHQNAFGVGQTGGGNGTGGGGGAPLEASWNFDLGFENGLDMDDESTRNFLHQLLN